MQLRVQALLSAQLLKTWKEEKRNQNCIHSCIHCNLSVYFDYWLLWIISFKTFEELRFNVVSRCKQEFSIVLLFTKKPYYIQIHEYVWIYGGMGDVYYLSTYFIY